MDIPLTTLKIYVPGHGQECGVKNFNMLRSSMNV